MGNTSLLSPVRGSNALGAGAVVGDRYRNSVVSEVAATYAATPVFEADSIPRSMAAHLGGGIFMRRCRACDDYLLSYGPLGFEVNFAKHEASHDIQVAGYNVPAMK